MARRSSPTKSRRTIAVLILISVTVLTIDARSSGPIRQVRSAAQEVFSPVRTVADKVFSPFRSVWHGAFRYDDVKRENDRLRAENEKLKGDAALGKAAGDKLDALQKATSLPYLTKYKKVAAEVVYGPASNYDDTFIVAKGSNDGINLGDPAVTGSGLIGRVIEVSASTSVVRRVTDRHFGVGARVVPATNGLIVGTGDGGVLQLTNVLLDVKVNVGDLVETSGAAGSGLPAGIPIGVVAKVRNKSGSGFLEVDVTPSAAVGDVVFVTIMALKATVS